MTCLRGSELYARAMRLRQRAEQIGNQLVLAQQDHLIPYLATRLKSLEETSMDGSLSLDDVLEQLRMDLAEAESALQEVRAAGFVLAAKHLQRTILERKRKNIRLAGGKMTHDMPPELIEHYFGLESFEVIEELLALCGATVDVRALPTLTRRLREEDAQVPTLEARGYIRMREKSQHLIASLKPLIEALEGMSHDRPSEQLGTQPRGTS